MSNEKKSAPPSWSPLWEEVFLSQAWGKYPSESLVQFIARNFYSVPKRDCLKILEVGCGPGPNIWYLAREGFSTYGIDGSQEAIRLAEERLTQEGLSAHLEVGDINILPYSNNFFDAAIDVECLYANPLTASKNILKEIQRCLKPGGLLYSRTLTDQMYIGKSQTCCGHLEYSEISDGPIAGKGFARLMGREDVNSLYGIHFDIQSLDSLEYTRVNGTQIISEWIIVARKREKHE